MNYLNRMVNPSLDDLLSVFVKLAEKIDILIQKRKAEAAELRDAAKDLQTRASALESEAKKAEGIKQRVDQFLP